MFDIKFIIYFIAIDIVNARVFAIFVAPMKCNIVNSVTNIIAINKHGRDAIVVALLGLLDLLLEMFNLTH